MDIRLDFLEEGYFYHIYNRGINGCRIFKDDKDQQFFCKKMKEYLSDYLEVYAYCLMPNHYHLVVKVKEFVTLTNSNKEVGLHCDKCIASKQLGKLMSSYTQAFNKRYERHGALLEKPFKRKRITENEYLEQVIVYVNRNPLDIDENIEEYLYSSYKSILSSAPTSIQREEVLSLFAGIENFKYCHSKESLYRFEFD